MALASSLAESKPADKKVWTFYFGYDDQPSQQDNDYDDMIIRATVTSAVPEPVTWAMMLIGFGATAGAMRSAKRRLKPARPPRLRATQK